MAGVAVITGMTLPIVNTIYMTIIQTVVPVDKMGRVSSVDQSLSMAIFPIGTLISGPLAELIHHLNEVRSDPDQLKNLGGVLEELRKKLPKELGQGDEGLLLDDPEWLAQILGQVSPMLIRRLMGKGGNQ